MCIFVSQIWLRECFTTVTIEMQFCAWDQERCPDFPHLLRHSVALRVPGYKRKPTHSQEEGHQGQGCGATSSLHCAVPPHTWMLQKTQLEGAQTLWFLFLGAQR